MAMLQSAYDAMVVGLFRSHGRAIVVAAALGLVLLALQSRGSDIACPEASCGIDNSRLQSVLRSF